MKLLVKLSNGNTIPVVIKSSDTIETLKLYIAFYSNIPKDHFELMWNDEFLIPESLELCEIDVNGEKLPLNQWNINNLIFVKLIN